MQYTSHPISVVLPTTSGLAAGHGAVLPIEAISGDAVADFLLGTIANLLQVAGALAAVFFFFVSPKRQQQAADWVISKADWLGKMSWHAYLSRASTKSAVLLAKLYGTGARHKRGWSRYLTRRAFRTSGVIAAAYLAAGATAAASFMFASGRAADASLAARVLGAIVVVSCLISAAWAWRRVHRAPLAASSATEKLSSVAKCAILTVCVPMLAGGIGYAFSQRGGGAKMPALYALALLPLFLFLLYAGLKDLISSFDIFLPLGLFLYVLVAALVTGAMLELLPAALVDIAVPAAGPSLIGVSTCVGLLIFLPTANARFSQQSPKLAWVLFAGGLFLMAAPLLKYKEVLFVQTYQAGPTLLAMHFSIAVSIAVMASMAYANSVCDAVSVAITRRLLIPMARSRAGAQFWLYFLVDAAAAAALMVATYLIFAAMTYFFLWMSSLPVESFLRGLWDFQTWIAAPVNSAKLSGDELTRSLGADIGKFTFAFGLSALLPTAMHLILLTCWAVFRLTLGVLAMPARALVDRWQVLTDVSNGQNRTLYESWLIGGVCFLSLGVLYAAARLLEAALSK